MTETAPVGRRERKKAATRAMILDAATSLFLERGFDAVTVREIADNTDVSPKTVFTHFPQKEALVFSDDGERHDRLVVAVTGRSPGVTISDALKAHYRAEITAHSGAAEKPILGLVESTPSLVDYAEKMWFRHEDALAAAIAHEFGLDEPPDAIRFYVRFALQIQLISTRDTDPIATMETGFQLLDSGWNNCQGTIGLEA